MSLSLLQSFKLKLDSGAYWQERVRVLSDSMVNHKMKVSGMSEGPARKAMSHWICGECKIDLFSPSILTVNECKRVVALLHKDRPFMQKSG